MSIAARLASAVARRAPRWDLERVVRRGQRLGRLAFRVDRRHRGVASANLAKAFPERDRNWHERTARRSFEQAGRTLLETLWSPRLEHDHRDYFDFRGLEHVTRALGEGRGVLVASAHFGNWETMALGLVYAGVPLTSIARPLDDPGLERLLHGIRTRNGHRVLPKRNAAREVLRTLRRNEAVTILADQNTIEREAVFAPYFGRPAATTPALGTFHARTEAPIVPVFAVPRETGYMIDVQEPLRIARGTREERIAEVTTAITARIEAMVRATPEAWLWMHDRWRTRP